MCGIAGIFNPAGLYSDNTPVIKNMLARINYRGPDESGIFLDDKITLGSVRLSIIDLSTGQQPLSTPDETLWIVFNGEIFNYIELREDLSKKGHVFRTRSDTEVLLHAYQEYGTTCLRRLNGQFALAIWDRTKQELFLARDRVGIRPLYYTRYKGTLVFGSEVKALLEFPGIKCEFDLNALSQVFTFWSTVTPNTVFHGILEIPPGHFMKICGNKTEIKQWWNLAFPVETGEIFKDSIDEAGEELDELLTDAVRLRLRADVPVAAYLSGGLDSSATTALIKKVAPDILQTYSIGFEGREFDETPYQQEVSRYLDTRHTAFSCTNEEIGQYFPLVVWHAEIPILRTAPVPMYCLSKKVRENNIKVVITGEGADEMLAGYDIFKEAIIREFWSRQPDSKLRPLLLNRLYPYLGQFQERNKTMLKFFFGYKLNDTESPFYSHLIRWHNATHLLNYFSGDLRATVKQMDPLQDVTNLLDPHFASWSGLGKAQWLETVLFMSGYLLSSQGDRVAMANSVEGRYPFLDYRVMEFTAKLPPEFKMHGLNEKYILKRIMQNRIPQSVLKRPKQAYRAPIADSFISSSHHLYVNELLSEKGILDTGLFDPVAVQKLTHKIKANQFVSEVDNMALAGILSTQILYHQYIAQDRFKVELQPLKNCNTIINYTSSETI